MEKIKPDKKNYDKALKDFEDRFSTNDSLNSYFLFSKFIQSCFISEDGYIIGTGSFQTVNLELMYHIREKIEKHPLLWRLFFMIA